VSAGQVQSSDRVVLSAAVASTAGTVGIGPQGATYQWELIAEDGSSASNAFGSTGRSRVAIIAPNTLEAGVSYAVKLEVTSSGQTESALVTLNVY